MAPGGVPGAWMPIGEEQPPRRDPNAPLDDEVCSLDLKLLEDQEEPEDVFRGEAPGPPGQDITDDLPDREEDLVVERAPNRPSSSKKHTTGHDAFYAAIAASFASAEKVLHESHENALQLLARCREEIQQKDKINCDFRTQLDAFDRSHFTRSSTPQREVAEQPRPASRPGQPAVALKPPQRKKPKSLSWATPANLRDEDEGLETSFRPPTKGSPPDAPSECAPRMQMVSSATPAEKMMSSDSPRHSLADSEPSGGQSVAPSVISHRSARVPSTTSDRLRRPSVASYASARSKQSKQTYELLDAWTRQPMKRRIKKRTISRGMSFESLGSLGSLGSVESDPMAMTDHWHPLRSVVMNPNSGTRAGWDIASIVLVIYDMVMIPLQLFDIPESTASLVFQWTTRLFWTCDIVLSFFTGVLQPNGSIEYRLAKIAKHYLSTWFAVDFLIVGSDWVEVLWSDGGFLGFARAGKASRTFRIIRMIRLLRLARVRNVISMITERMQSEQLIIIAGIISIMLVIMGLGHVIACIWYGIGDQDRPDTWLRQHNFEDADLEMKYFTALHWSLLQFAGGTDEIVPQNSTERVYAVSVFLLAFVMASVFVGRLTSSMTQLHILSKKDIEKFQVLKRYLIKNEISSMLTMRVLHNAQHALAETQRFMEESSVELLNIISQPLRVELHFELYAPVLAVHPFFRCFIDACPQVLAKVCHLAMSQLLVSTGDILFMVGEVPSPARMFIVCTGELSYHFVTGAMAIVQSCQWISEATLWTPWAHQGMLKAASDCRLCVLDSAKFMQLVEKDDYDFDVRLYARTFVHCMNTGGIGATDLPFSEDDECIMQVITSLAEQKDEANDTPLQRQGSSPSLSSTSPTFSEDVVPVAGRRKSVLMAAPVLSISDSKRAKNAWR